MVAEGYDPAAVPGDLILELPDPHWFDHIRNSVASLARA